MFEKLFRLQEHGTTVETLVSLNGIADADLIIEGQQLTVG